MKNLSNNSTITASAILFALIIGPMGAFAASPATVNLGTAGNFAILAKTGISTTGATSIVGDIGLSPAAATYITGFSLTLMAASPFSTSALVAGKIYAPGYADPTAAILTAAVLDMQVAYIDAAGRAPGVTELGAGNIGGLTLAPGVYKWGTGLTIPTDVTLSGGANDIWIFQVAGNLNISSGVKVVLAGGARANNIFWVVAGQTTIGTTAVFNGNILDQTTIVLNTGAQLNGRALAQAAVTLDSNAVTEPSFPSSAVVVTPVTTTTPSQGTGAATTTTTGTTVIVQAPAVIATPATQAQKDQLNSLLVTLQSLQAQQAQQQNSSAGASSFGQQIRAIAINLGKGSSDSNVGVLQNFLISQNKGSAAKALANVGATGYFGVLTRAALAEFQANVGISPASGNFGAITRAYISAHY